jgi:hypothetical protein
MDDITQHPRYREARRYACKVRGFYTHLCVYLLVNGCLIALNYMGSPARVWWMWPAFGWGIGLLAHAVSVFAFGGAFGASWEERKVREYLSRHP